MGKKSRQKKQQTPVKKKKSKKLDTLDYIALIIFIVIGLGILSGALWYYVFHLPSAEEAMTEISVEFTYAFFDFGPGEFTGVEAEALMSERRAQIFRQALPGIMATYDNKQVESRVKSDVEVEVLERGYNTGTTRAIFWQYETDIDKGPREVFMFYTYEFVYEDGEWRVDRIITPSVGELERFRTERGVLPDDNGEDE